MPITTTLDVPPLTTNQFAVLCMLYQLQQTEGVPVSSPILQVHLGYSGPTFYRMMTRLSELGLIQQTSKPTYGQGTGSYYKLTKKGFNQCQTTIDWWSYQTGKWDAS